MQSFVIPDDPEGDFPAAEVLRRRQFGAAVSSFMLFTAMAHAGGYSPIWDDLNAREETRAEVRDLPRP